MSEAALHPTAIEVLEDGQWHWVPSVPTGELIADKENTLWIHRLPSELGYYPRPRYEGGGYRAEYVPEAPITYLGMDIYATNGLLQCLGKEVLAVVMPWPAPEFMGLDNQDNHWFIRAWTPRERASGHFHMPLFGATLEAGIIRKIARQRQAAQN